MLMCLCFEYLLTCLFYKEVSGANCTVASFINLKRYTDFWRGSPVYDGKYRGEINNAEGVSFFMAGKFTTKVIVKVHDEGFNTQILPLYLCSCTCVRSRKVKKILPFHSMLWVIGSGKGKLFNQTRLRIMY